MKNNLMDDVATPKNSPSWVHTPNECASKKFRILSIINVGSTIADKVSLLANTSSTHV